ncbi:DUF6759 domain-containing protein [Bergeyella zoohelcum]|uniref:DUF6759 domain-containing protein n=1 Tax=Bergeyella zoohelcum TaxID=1015 RepID=A0A7Z8YS54_9FLAO|nr:DUF6759 domain-containing protein [Bergeyella zoohelcum]VDH05177.1 Uncharacterised protein [Bergeyella zoohelcum]
MFKTVFYAKKGLAIISLGIAFSCNQEKSNNLISEETADFVSVVVDSAVSPSIDLSVSDSMTYVSEEEPITPYEKAERENTSYAWKRFLEENPNHPNKKEISEKIIRLEVDEILADNQTGQMPSFDNYSTKHSSTSTVEIKNDTGCELTVRYSGVEAKILHIPNGNTQTIILKSGSYKIAASACGKNYAGDEDLHGNYGSTFYISRRYGY